MIKKCKICTLEKNDTDFYVGRNQCKECLILKTKDKRMPKEYYKEYYQNNKEVRNKYHKDYVEKNVDSVAELKHEWYLKNRQHNIDKRKELHYRKLKEDPLYKLKFQIRSRFARAISGNYKAGSAVANLGCSIEELKTHLESKFQPGMTWENYGIKGWHIDHIQPLDNFDLTNLEQLKTACHYSNLQPLWWQDNLRKGNK